jgi:hypothetical protein
VQRSPLLRIGVAALVAAVVLLAPGSARADPYWFFQGYLPQGDGTRQVFHANVCCTNLNWIRMSWEVGSHPQKFVFVRRSDYGWDGLSSSCWDCWAYYTTPSYVKGGCQNPFPYTATWTNCRISPDPPS